MRQKLFRLILFAAVLIASSNAKADTPVEETGVSALLQIASEQKLSSDRAWHLLLHYKQAPLWPGVHSLVDSPEFFLAKDGKTNPEAELTATVLALLGPDHGDRSTLRCRFPARFQFLKAKLLDEHSNPKESLASECPKLVGWLSDFSDTQLTLVFASAFLNNPASMFGHTFLRLDTGRESARSPLLDYAISFAARTQEEKGPFFAAKGLSGFYKGSFSLSPYHTHVRNYGSIDDRDLWEYSLNLNPAEVERMLLHLWELRHAYFDYYFIDENCSYHLLPLLEVARPELELSDRFRWYAIPSDTLQQVLKASDILSAVRLRPSKSREVRARLMLLSRADRKLAADLVQGECAAESVVASTEANSSLSDVFAVALDTVQYQKHNEPRRAAEYEAREVELLRAANSLVARPQKLTFNEDSIRPDKGHASKRLQLSYGSENSEQFWEADLRLTYHDKLDPSGGFPEGADLQFLKTAVRYEPRHGNTSIEEVTLIDILSRPIWDEFIRPFSWGARVGASRLSFTDEERSLVPELKLKGGITAELLPALTGSILASAGAQTNARLDDNFASLTGLEFLATYDSSEKWRTELSALGDVYLNGFSGNTYTFWLAERYTLQRNLALVAELARSEEFGPAFNRAMISLRSYF